MRLWSIHPKYLDAKGLVALWREGLLAQAVLKGRTRGYRNHPQLERFKNHPRPTAAINCYLHSVCDEAERRGYRFDRSKLSRRIRVGTLKVTTGQLTFELEHLRGKLLRRDRKAYNAVRTLKVPRPHPLFKCVRGSKEKWEKGKKSKTTR